MDLGAGGVRVPVTVTCVLHALSVTHIHLFVLQRDTRLQIQYFPAEGRLDKMFFPYYGKKAHVSKCSQQPRDFLVVEEHQRYLDGRCLLRHSPFNKSPDCLHVCCYIHSFLFYYIHVHTCTYMHGDMLTCLHVNLTLLCLQPDYVQPLVAVKLLLSKDDYNVEHTVECKVEGSDLRNSDDRDKFLGRVIFRVKVSE